MFKIAKVQHTDPVIYLLDDYHGKSISGAFYEYELHRAAYLVKKALHRRGDEIYVNDWDSMHCTILGYTRII